MAAQAFEGEHMPRQEISEKPRAHGRALRRRPEVVRSADVLELPEYPVREYIAGMTHELAQMARWDGDEVLAGLLEAVTARAETPRP